MESISDREQILLAMVAVEDGRLGREALLAALDLWASRPAGGLFEILVDQNALTEADAEELLLASSAAESAPIWNQLDSTQALRDALDESGLRKGGNRPAGSTLPSNPLNSPPPNGQRRFDIGIQHATGGLGEVLRATDRQLNREVAVKRIRMLWADDADARARFLQEAKVTGRLEHPGIVPVYALGVGDDQRPYYAMRFIAGDSLEQAIERFHKQAAGQQDRVAFNSLLQRLVDVCNTVEYAHSRGVIHRDLKPANVMLGPYGETVVVDWGLAKQVDDLPCGPTTTRQAFVEDGSMPTQLGSAVGTPQYMSPEQAAGHTDQHSTASDVFNLGATLYHLLTGRPPYRGRDLAEVIDRATHCRFSRPRSVRASLAKPLEAICLKAMMPEPIARYASAAELGQDLQRWLADESVLAYRDPWIGRIARWMRHHQARVAAVVVAGVLIVVGAVVGAAAWASFEQRQYAARLAIEAQDRARLAELETAAATASEFATSEMRAGNYASALGILDNATRMLAGERRLDDVRSTLLGRLERAGRIVQFHRLSQRSDELSYRGHNPEALHSTQAALESLQVLDHGDWWNRLPIEDLTAEQSDALTWSVYRELIKLSSLYADAAQRQLALDPGNPLAALLGSSGKAEAQAARAADRLVQRFRPSEANRWIAGMMGLRLGMPTAVSPRMLSEPHNAADAYALGMLNMFAAESPQFPFRGYRDNDDALVNAADAFRLASELEPNHYWTHLFLGFIEMTCAQRAHERGETDAWLHFADARQALGRCVALNPEDPFAYAERSVAYWREAAALATSADVATHAHRIARLRDMAVRDAQHARDLDPDNPWLYWYEGHAIEETGQRATAAAAYLQAIRLGWDFGGTTDMRPVKADQTRAIPEALAWAERQLSQSTSERIYEVLLAAARLASSSPDLQQALAPADRACQLDPTPDFAWSVRGLIRLQQGDFKQAIGDFQRALEQDSSDVWAAFGIAECLARDHQHASSLEAYANALAASSTNEHRAAAELGRCRALLHLERPSEAAAAVVNAKRWQVSCNTEEIQALASQLKADEVLAVLARSAPDVTSRLISDDAHRPFQTLPLCNGGFELGLAKYWGNSNEGGPVWWKRGRCRATATIDRSRFHGGGRSLLIQNPSEGDSRDFATTAQTVPAAGGTRYRLTLWAAAERLSPSGLRIEVDQLDDPVVVELPAGSYGWTQLQGDFETPAADSHAHGSDLMNVTIRIVSAGAGDAWLDDLHIEQLPAR